MSIIELAKETFTKEGFSDLEKESLPAFAQAVIEDYKASLVPVGTTYVSNFGYMEVELYKIVNAGVPLYALGETND